MSGPTCPRCGGSHAPEERFCGDCGLPLVVAGWERVGEAVLDERGRRARKIKPQYTEGGLVRVGTGRNQAEAEFMQGLLLEEGVPSTLRRTRGFDVPDMLAAGPRDVFVPASGATAAREVLLDAELASDRAVDAGPRPGRVLAGLLAAVVLVALIALVGTELLPR